MGATFSFGFWKAGESAESFVVGGIRAVELTLIQLRKQMYDR